MAAGSNDKEPTEELPTQLASEDRIEAKIDRDLRDSFPASDPPGWTLGVKQPHLNEKGEDAESSSPLETGETNGE